MHTWELRNNVWVYLGAMSMGPFSKLLDLARSNTSFYVMFI